MTGYRAFWSGSRAADRSRGAKLRPTDVTLIQLVQTCRSLYIPRVILRGSAWSPRRAQAELQYGGTTFELASRALRRVDEGQSDLNGILALLRTDPAGARALLSLLARLPRLDVVLTDAPAGRAIREYLEMRRRGVSWNRVAQGVLALPPSRDRYLSGHHRQALRTNLRHAKALGIRCVQIRDPTARREMLKVWAQRRGEVEPDVDDWVASEPSSAAWWAAVDREDLPLAFAAISIDAHWALIHNTVSVSHPARWSLHTALVSAAIEDGARHLQVAVPSALRLDAGSRHFQRLLGYRVAHLVLKRRPSVEPHELSRGRRRRS